MNYEELLKRAKNEIPKTSDSGERFNPPAVKSFIEGKTTIVQNLKNISKYLNRDINHIIKYLSKELATSGNIDGNRVIFTGKFKNYVINSKMGQYIDDFVKCKECGSPDTKIEKENRIKVIHCMACQAVKPLPKIR